MAGDADNGEHTAVLEPMNDEVIQQLKGLLAGRRTINLFDAQPVPENVLLDAIDAARWAPNHRLTQPWRFRLFAEQTTRRVIDLEVELAAARNGLEAGTRRRQRLEAIPGWFAVTSLRSDDELMDTENYAATSCAIQNLSLYLWARGVGVKWSTGAVTRDPRFFDLIGTDAASERVVGLFWYGYPAMVPEQKRLPTQDIVTRLP